MQVPKLVASPTRVPSAGNKPKIIDEFVGALNTKESGISIARMRSPAGWNEPGQRPEFREFTLVLSGTLHVEYETGKLDVRAGQAIICEPGEWVRYSTPEEATEYIAICLPAFSLLNVHRDA
jgi:quercetin dioxygenase-like cupin family protein